MGHGKVSQKPCRSLKFEVFAVTGFDSFWEMGGNCHCSPTSLWDSSGNILSFTICKTNGYFLLVIFSVPFPLEHWESKVFVKCFPSRSARPLKKCSRPKSEGKERGE